MTLLFASLSILLILITALYLQLPTFILALGYGWTHKHAKKRWIFRFFALDAFIVFIFLDPPLYSIIATAVPFAALFLFSLINASSNVFAALDENHILKQKELIYDLETEIVGYCDPAGASICYPIEQIVMPRHLINDTFNGNPLFISYCPACKSTMIYNPMVLGTRLTFEVICVYRRNMIIADLQTETLWQQGTGEGVYGALKGKHLEYLAYQQMKLGDWLKEYPDSIIVQEHPSAPKGILPKKILMKAIKVTDTFVGPGRTELSGLPLREKVWGLELNGISKAYPVSELQKSNGFSDTFGGTEIRISYNPNTNQIDGEITASGEALRFQNHWWFGWKEFHPDTEIWKFH
jgi:hypothetical protein